MKKKWLNLFLVMSTVSFTFVAAFTMPKDNMFIKKTAWLQPDSTAYCQLGRSLSEILFSSSKVECFLLQYKEKPTKEDVEVEHSIVRGKSLGFLNIEQRAILRYTLFVPAESYQKDSIRVRAPYNPILEFVFYHKKMQQEAHVIMSPNDFSWTVFYDDKRQFKFNFANKETVVRFCKSILDSKSTTFFHETNKK